MTVNIDLQLCFCCGWEVISHWRSVPGMRTSLAQYVSDQVWEMDKPDHMMLLPVERAELLPSPLVRVNKPANLLAVSTAGNSLNILANAAGLQLLGTQKPLQPPRPDAPIATLPAAPVVRRPACKPANHLRLRPRCFIQHASCIVNTLQVAELLMRRLETTSSKHLRRSCRRHRQRRTSSLSPNAGTNLT